MFAIVKRQSHDDTYGGTMSVLTKTGVIIDLFNPLNNPGAPDRVIIPDNLIEAVDTLTKILRDMAKQGLTVMLSSNKTPCISVLASPPRNWSEPEEYRD